MCDYSLHNVESRPARVGDKLVTTSFANTITQGFAGVERSEVAVCLRPGTEIAFESEPKYFREFTRWLPRVRAHRATSKVARFCLINQHRADAHHDALELPDGSVVLLTRICPGQRATVLQLPADLPRASVRGEQRWPMHVG
jgi:hypothetical protein